MTRTPEERLAALETWKAGADKDIETMASDVREIRDAILTAKGGWKALAVVFALGSAIGGVATKLAEFLPSIIR